MPPQTLFGRTPRDVGTSTNVQSRDVSYVCVPAVQICPSRPFPPPHQVMDSSWFAEFQRDLRASVVKAVQGGMRGVGSATTWTARTLLAPAAVPFR